MASHLCGSFHVSLNCVNVLSHMEQANGFSPEWIIHVSSNDFPEFRRNICVRVLENHFKEGQLCTMFLCPSKLLKRWVHSFKEGPLSRKFFFTSKLIKQDTPS